MRPTRASVLLAALAVLFAAALLLQYRTTRRLRGEIAAARQQLEEHERLRAEHAALLARQSSAAELARWRSDHAALPRLKSEINAAQHQVANIEAARSPESSVILIPADAWQAKGFNTTPADALETLFWAALHHDLSLLTTGVSIDPQAANALWADTPGAVREKYADPSHLIAALLAQDGETIAFVGIVREQQTDPDTATITARLENAGHQGKTDTFELHRRDGTWQITIPKRVLDRYAAKRAAAE